MYEESKFKFWCPIEKSQDIDPTTGEPIMKLGGIASTSDEDSDGEFLDPKGFDIKPLLESGMVNWHHQAKGQPAAIIGEPTKAEIRPEGLYIETTLYPSSQVAHDVWNLAQTLEKDSKTRRLGYSIEGKVLKRKSDDKNSPDFKKISKAVITGVAITHQPKNPKTFANIIKGDIDDDFKEEEEEEVEEKSIDTENAAALKKESVDKKIKNQTFSKSEVVEKVLGDIAGISIQDAEKIYKLTLNIANMKKRKITDEDISKAYETLGLDAPSDIQKGCGSDEDTIKKDVKKSEDEDDDNEEDYNEEESDENDESNDESNNEEDNEDEEEKSVKKGGVNAFDRIEKALEYNENQTSRFIRALGVMVKDVSQKASQIMDRNEELMDIIKSQEDTINEMSNRLEELGSEVPGRKSISSSRVIDRSFSKGNDDELNEEKPSEKNSKSVSMSRQPNLVADILDQATFNKGYDDEFSKACLSFEASKTLPSRIISRVKNEFGIDIVK